MEFMPYLLFSLIVPWFGTYLHSFSTPGFFTAMRTLLLGWTSFVLVVSAVVFYFGRNEMTWTIL